MKTAVLDYLKRYHPTDTETYSMVALNLMMYREIAQQLENKAIHGLDRLKGKPLGTLKILLSSVTDRTEQAVFTQIKLLLSLLNHNMT